MGKIEGTTQSADAKRLDAARALLERDYTEKKEEEVSRKAMNFNRTLDRSIMDLGYVPLASSAVSVGELGNKTVESLVSEADGEGIIKRAEKNREGFAIVGGINLEGRSYDVTIYGQNTDQDNSALSQDYKKALRNDFPRYNLVSSFSFGDNDVLPIANRTGILDRMREKGVGFAVVTKPNIENGIYIVELYAEQIEGGNQDA